MLVRELIAFEVASDDLVGFVSHVYVVVRENADNTCWAVVECIGLRPDEFPGEPESFLVT